MNGDEKTVGGAYAWGELARAFVTASTHEDEQTRDRAEERVRRWRSVLGGMAAGTLRVGSRTPVAGLPAWVTPEVVRGGFATGEPAAGGPLRPHEVDWAHRAGVPAERGALFAYFLTDAGLAELSGLLDSGRYRVELPEEAALPVMVWLLRSGDRLGALTLVDTIAPFRERLRFAPAPSDLPTADPQSVSRQTVGEVREAVGRRQPNERVEAMREALTVWNPFADDLLSLWCETMVDGRVAARFPAGWLERGAGLLDRYRQLAATHTRCAKHRKPKENLAIIRTALAEVVAGREVNPRQRGLLQHAVDSMLRKRGRPDSAEHRSVRAQQAGIAARPGHHRLAGIVVDRLGTLPQEAGTPDPESVLGPVEPGEEEATGVPAGSPIPPAIARVVARATAGPVERLVDRGVIGSAEVLAQLTPQITAAVAAAAYPDPVLAALMGATYRAFRNRRSLLLLDLAHQVRQEELPWVQAVAGMRVDSDDTRENARRTLVRMGNAFVTGFPATAMPNPLISELATLSTQAGMAVPWVEELATDIFMGTFTVKFLRAAKVAARLLTGSLYERYYDIDYAAVAAFDEKPARVRGRAGVAPAFDVLCQERADARRSIGTSVAANGTVIEQAQILTTHNLAALVDLVGVEPAAGWPDLYRRSLRSVFQLVDRLQHNPRPLTTVKDAAYAWRQSLFYLSLTKDPAPLVAQAREDLATRPPHVRERLTPALVGLAHVADGGRFDRDGTAGAGRRLLGWTTTRHWLLGPSVAW
jgi:hypothetical protein